ncbi:heat shock protein 18.2 [Actinidia rufa]|uniref:Heat shock protein 18.2 n=1 Tax=Actinidia rufa TaxID=165716 RepID=A0A7J0GKG1_9ERIC|nr:heat shock protein 18.2 [Actinidia rufa]
MRPTSSAVVLLLSCFSLLLIPPPSDGWSLLPFSHRPTTEPGELWDPFRVLEHVPLGLERERGLSSSPDGLEGNARRTCYQGGRARPQGRGAEERSCSSRRYGAPAPNRVGNGVRTRPHAPFEDRQVRSVSATRQGRSHALPRARGRTHAPTRAREEAARAATREEECPRALTRRAEAIMRSHTRGEGGVHARLTLQAEARAREAPRGATCAATLALTSHIKLEEMYQAKTSRNKALLMRRLVNLKLQRETTVAEHTSEFQSLVNQLTSVDLQFDDEMQALLLLSSLSESWETLVVSLSNSVPNGKLTTSMVMDALFNEEARRKEMGSTDQSESQALVSDGSRERGRGQGRGHHRDTGKGWDCPKYKAQDQSSDTAATAVMAVDESEVLLAASDDGKSDLHARDVYGWRTTQLAELLLAEGQSGSAWQTGSFVTLTEVRHVPNLRKNLISIGMLDAKGCSFDASRGILRVSKGNKEMLWGKKTRGLYRLEGNVQIGGATIRHGSSGISEKNGQGKQPLHRGTQSKRRGTWRIWSGTRAQGDALGYVWKSGQTRVMQPVQDVHREAQRKETNCAHNGATTTRKVTYFAAHPGGGCGAPQWGVCVQGAPCSDAVLKSDGGAGSEVVRKDNLKTSDYPPVGWRGRLLSPAHLDESKPTWMSPSPVAKPKPDWSSYGVSMCDGVHHLLPLVCKRDGRVLRFSTCVCCGLRADYCEAKLENGVLTISFAKKSPDRVKGPKVVSIAVAAEGESQAKISSAKIPDEAKMEL